MRRFIPKNGMISFTDDYYFCVMKDDIVVINSIADYCKWCGFEAVNPLYTIVDMSDRSKTYPDTKVNLGLFAIWLACGEGYSIGYGMGTYDYKDGEVVCFAPGQVAQVDIFDRSADNSIGLVFHHDLLLSTPLGAKISHYSFFSYSQNESLSLSPIEEIQYMGILNAIGASSSDSVSSQHRLEICAHIESLLDLCQQSYERHSVRSKENEDLLARFEVILHNYFKEGRAEQEGFPTVSFLSDSLNLTPGYFGSRIKKETGLTVRQYIKYKIIVLAKQELLGSTLPVSEIARKVGFNYPQHFSRLFKTIVGMYPDAYRRRFR